jgi:hypothetical protein
LRLICGEAESNKGHKNVSAILCRFRATPPPISAPRNRRP